MRRVFVFMLVLIGTSAVFGQTKFNFLVGTNVTSFSQDLMSDYGFDQYRQDYISLGGSATSDIKNSVRMGFYLSAEADFYISEKAFVKTGVKYMTTGDSYFFKTNDVVFRSNTGSETDEKYKWRPRLDYLALPVNLGTDIGQRFSFFGGVTAGLNINNTLRINYFEPGKNDTVKEKWENLDTNVETAGLVFFLNGGVNYIIDQTLPFPVIMELRYHQSLNAVYSDPAFDGTTTQFNNTNLWNLEIGIGVKI